MSRTTFLFDLHNHRTRKVTLDPCWGGLYRQVRSELNFVWIPDRHSLGVKKSACGICSQRGRDSSRVQIKSFRARSERTARARSGAKPQNVRELGRGLGGGGGRTEIRPVVPIQSRQIEEAPDVAPSGTVLLHWSLVSLGARVSPGILRVRPRRRV